MFVEVLDHAQNGNQFPHVWYENVELRMKISIITNTSVLRFYGYIGDISADILEKNIDKFKIVKNS